MAGALKSELLGQGGHCPLDEKEIVCFVQAREIRALLPDIMETLQFGNVHVTLNALNIFRNMMNHLGKMVLRPITLELADKLLHLFNHVSLLREAEHCRWVLGWNVFSSLCPSWLSWDVYWALQPSRPCPRQLGCSWWCEAPVLGPSPTSVQNTCCQGLLSDCPVAPLLPAPGILPRCRSREVEPKQAACALEALPKGSPVSSLGQCLRSFFDMVGWLREHSEAQALHAGNLLQWFA